MLTYSTDTDIKHNIIGRVYTMETLFKQSRQEKAAETVDVNEYYRLYCETKQLLYLVQQKKKNYRNGYIKNASVVFTFYHN